MKRLPFALLLILLTVLSACLTISATYFGQPVSQAEKLEQQLAQLAVRNL